MDNVQRNFDVLYKKNELFFTLLMLKELKHQNDADLRSNFPTYFVCFVN